MYIQNRTTMKISQKLAIHIKIIAQIVYLLQFVDSVLCLTTTHVQNGGYVDKSQSYTGDSQTKTWNIPHDDPNVALYSDLIHILEQLNVLTVRENSSACIALEKIVRNVTSANTNDNSRNVGVFLYFKETTHSSGYPQTANGNNINSNHQHDTSVIHVHGSGCSQAALFSTSGLDSLSMKQETRNGTRGDDGNQTLVLHPGDERHNVDTRYGGLSRTQVVVIATCSAVIGTFFIIAGALRISNFYKRYQERRALRDGIDGQSGSLGFPATYGDIRRPSAMSKASRQGSSTVRGGSEGHVNRLDKSANSSQSPSPVHASDHKPLLWLTSLGNTQTSTGSSHGSLAYIDEDEQSRIKLQDGGLSMDEDDSEDDPLLRKSPDSGSSINASNDDVERMKYVTSCSGIPNGDERTPLVNVRNEADVGRNSEHIELVLNGPSVSPVSGEEEITNSAISDELAPDYGSDPNLLDSNADDLDAMITEPEVSVDEEIEVLDESVSQSGNISESFVVTIGLNQSENSLSNNPSYCYGNQSEYALDGGYGNIAYNSPYQIQEPEKHPYWHVLSMHDSTDNDSGYRGNGLYIESDACQSENDSPGDTSTKEMSISNDSSGEPVLSAHAQCYTASSCGDISESGEDNSALQDCENEPKSRSTNLHKQYTVESQIIPLSEYNTMAP